MLETTRPNVLHVTTPPHTHHAIALRALGGGVHVYVEKPFAVNAAEADEIIAAAEAASRLACVGHDQLLDPTWSECRRLVCSGTIGRVVHVDSYQGYDLDGPFGRTFANDPDHWLRRLPGGLFQNVMSHALYRITDLAGEDLPRVSASWLGEKPLGLPTELRATLLWPDMSAHLVFTSTARPIRRVAKVHGTRGGFEVDLDAQVIGLTGGRLRGIWQAGGADSAPPRAAGNSAANIWRFLRANPLFEECGGFLSLSMRRFWRMDSRRSHTQRSVSTPPSWTRYSTLVARGAGRGQRHGPSLACRIKSGGWRFRMRVLVTGGTGFLGRRLVAQLLVRGSTFAALRDPRSRSTRRRTEGGLRSVNWTLTASTATPRLSRAAMSCTTWPRG